MSAKIKQPYPVFLDLSAIPVLVVGGGAVAARKAQALLASNAKIKVVTRAHTPAFTRMEGIRIVKRSFRPSDLNGMRLAFAATDDPALNATIASLAKARGCWVNVATPPEAGDRVVPWAIRRGPLCVAITPGGVAAAAAKSLRLKLEKELDMAWARYLALLKTRREKIKKSIHDPKRRRRILTSLGRIEWVDVVRQNGARQAGARMDALIRQASIDTPRPRHR